VEYPYLVVSTNIENSHADVISISNFRRTKEKIKKKIKKGIGLEIMITNIRKSDSAGIGRWFEDIRELHSLCRLVRCQLIISSGANSIYEMVPGASFDAILRSCRIVPQHHWHEMNEWLMQRLSRRVLN
jgi:RNase P/RNase MRP subunit p30